MTVESEYPDVPPWFSVTTEPGPYAADWEDGYPYDTGAVQE